MKRTLLAAAMSVLVPSAFAQSGGMKGMEMNETKAAKDTMSHNGVGEVKERVGLVRLVEVEDVVALEPDVPDAGRRPGIMRHLERKGSPLRASRPGRTGLGLSRKLSPHPILAQAEGYVRPWRAQGAGKWTQCLLGDAQSHPRRPGI